MTIDDIRAHVVYLQSTLIPDLRESGMDATADDFETCVEAIEQLLPDED